SAEGAEGGEIAPGIRLAEERAPDLVAGEHRRQETSLLRLGPVRDQRRPGIVDPDPVQELRRASAGELLVQDRLRRRARAPAAVLARPEKPDVAGRPEPALPVAQEAELLGERRVVVRDALRPRRAVRGEPGAEVLAESLVLGGVGEIHRRLRHSIASVAIPCGGVGSTTVMSLQVWGGEQVNRAAVSVLLPAFAAAATLDACLRSIIRQTEARWECILVDDGSTDATPEIARAWAAREPRVRVVHTPHRGLVAALAAGLGECRA